MPEESRFTITFEGAPLEEGAMDVEDLAPALLGLADVIDEINGVATHGEAHISLRVRAGFKQGSFEVELEIAQKFYDQLVDLFNSRQITAWATFFSLLGLSGHGIIQLVRRSKGQKPKSAIEIEQTTRMRVIFEGEDALEVEKGLWRLFNSHKARAGLARFTHPLRREGMRRLTLMKSGHEPVAISREEAPYFSPPTEYEGELVTEAERVLRIVGMSFKEGNKWRVTDGTATFFVSISDEAFADRVQRGTERFGANDCLRVVLRTRQWYEGSELKATHEIITLLEHIKGNPDQVRLDFDGDRTDKQ